MLKIILFDTKFPEKKRYDGLTIGSIETSKFLLNDTEKTFRSRDYEKKML